MHSPFTEKEIRTLFKHQDLYFVDIILIMIHTGVRTMDLLNPIEYHLDDGYIVCSSKTEAGRDRIVPLHANIANLVKLKYSKHNRIFSEDKMSLDIFRRRFKKVMEELRMDHVPHDTRHTFISIIDNTVANEVAVQRIVGHSSKGITKKTYTHKDVEDLKKAMSYSPDFRA